MNNRKQRLILEQTDQKLKPFGAVVDVVVPSEGWIYTIRKALNMSLRQLAKRLNVSPQAVKGMEQREKSGAITLSALQDAAKSLDMKFVYGMVPNDGSLEELVKQRAMEVASEIVLRTSQSMKLEDQENSRRRLVIAIDEKMQELKNEMPKFLWD